MICEHCKKEADVTLLRVWICPECRERQFVDRVRSGGDSVTGQDHEDAIQERGNVFAFFLIAWFAIWTTGCAAIGYLWRRAHYWFTVKRVCRWCVPIQTKRGPRKPWIGGNPFARKSSDGICRRCHQTQLSILTARREGASRTCH